MSRTIEELECKNPQKVDEVVKAGLIMDEFVKVNEKGEEFWTNTKFPAHLCIKYTFVDNKMVLEGWVKIFRIASFIKSVYSEKNLTGLEAKLPKKAILR